MNKQLSTATRCPILSRSSVFGITAASVITLAMAASLNAGGSDAVNRHLHQANLISAPAQSLFA